MAPKRLEPWLGELVKRELEEVIAWKKETTKIGKKIKPDPDSRFSDDGSNFRSLVDAPPRPSRVQLIEVKSSADVASVIISDGAFKLEATLSEEALATFEEESLGPITKDVWGDVFQILRFTVVSTSLGCPYVKIDIDEIEYERPFRAVFGDPVAFEDETGVVAIRESIKQLRAGQVKSESKPDPFQLQTQCVTTGLSSEYPQSQQSLQTQNRAQRKPRGPTLASDGFEVEAGVNLQGPIHAMSGARVTDKNAAKLLALLPGKKPSIPESTSQKVTTASGDAGSGIPESQPNSPSIVQDTPIGPFTDKGQQKESTSTAGPSPAPSLQSTSNKAPPSAQLPTQSQPITSTIVGSPVFFAYGRRKIPSNQRKLLDHPSSWLPPLPGRQFTRPNVPIELLTRWNQEASTAPPDPSLSQRSNALASQQSASRSDASSGSDRSSSDEPLGEDEWPPSPQVVQAQQAMPPDSSPESDEPLESSPPRSPAGRMPPPSTIGSVVRGTQRDLEFAAPRPLAVRKATKRQHTNTTERELLGPNLSRKPGPDAPRWDNFAVASRHTTTVAATPPQRILQPLSQSALSASPPGTRTNSLPNKPTPCSKGFISRTSPRSTPFAASSLNHAAGPGVLNRRKRNREEEEMTPSQPEHVVPESSSRAPASAVRSAPASTQSKLHSGQNIQLSSPASQWHPQAASTQLQTAAASSQSQDPDEVQRLARQGFFDKARRDRRENWLKERYLPNRGGNLTLDNLMAYYKHEFPQDAGMTLDRFTEAARSVYPKCNITPGMRYQKCTSKEVMSQHAVAKEEGKLRRQGERAALIEKHKRLRLEWYVESSLKRVQERLSSSPCARFKQRYLPHSNKGTLRLRDIMTAYKSQYPTDNTFTRDELLVVAREAWPHAEVRTDTLFFERSLAHSPPRSRSNSRPTSSSGAGDSRLEALSWRRRAQQADAITRPKQLAALSALQPSSSSEPSRKPFQSNGSIGEEPMSAMTEFCHAFLSITPGNGSAFAQPQPPLKASRRVDVLSWKT